MEPKPSCANEPDDRLVAVLLEFLERADHGAPPEPAGLVARYPDLAPELEEFFDTWVRVEGLTEPIRSASHALREAARSGHHPAPAGEGDRGAAAAAPAASVVVGEPEGRPGGQPREATGGEGGWLGRWLRQNPPLAAEHYPFLGASRRQGEIGRLGPYRLLEVIGSGGMGIVFRGEDVSLRRPVAVKVLRAELAADPSFRERFLREARSAAAVDHEHVIAVYHVGEADGIPFLGMQWLRGVSLEELLRRGGRFDLATVLRLGRQTALGLAAAHGRGLLHRDIKPANLWIELSGTNALARRGSESASKGRVKILDFGLARAAGGEDLLTHSGMAVGTPAYMAPEQAAGGAVDVRCDLFGLGVVLYRMCSGQFPFPGRYSAAAEPPPPVRELNAAVPPGLSDLIAELLAGSPRRPSSAAEVAERLGALESREAVPAEMARSVAPPPAPPVPGSSGGSTWRRYAAGALALAVLLPLGYQFGGTVLRFTMNKGEVVIAVDDPDTEVTVTEGGAVIQDRKGQRQITLAAGEHELEVTIKDAGGESCFFTRAFVLSRGGKEVLHVRREPVSARPPAGGAPERGAAPDAGPLPGAGADRDRRVAEWALALGGRVRVQGTKGQQEFAAPAGLPAGVFRVVALYLGETAVNDAALAPVATLTDLEILDLRTTQVGDSGLAHVTGLTKLQALNLNGTRVSDSGLAQLLSLTRLENLELGKTRVSDAGLAHVKSLPVLRTLGLYGTPVTDAGLANIAAMASLSALNLGGTGVGDAELTRLGALQKLQSLDLSYCRVTDVGVSRLRALPGLQKLTLPGTKLTDAGLVHLAGMKDLVGLDLSDTRVTDAGMAHLSGLAGLESLNLGRSRVTDAGLAHLGALKRLRKLFLNGTRVTDAGLAHVLSPPLPPLAVLDLTATRVSAAGATALKGILTHARIEWSEPNRRAAEAVLAAGGSVHVRAAGRGGDVPVKDPDALPAHYFRLTRAGLSGVRKPSRELLLQLAALADPEFDNLEEVDLSGSAVSDADLDFPAALPVRRLVLDRAPVYGPGLVHLAKLPRLTDLSLGCPTLSFMGVRYLGELKRLERVSLAGSGATDTSLKYLHGLVKLRELDLTGTEVTAEGAAALKKVLPTCEIKVGAIGPR